MAERLGAGLQNPLIRFDSGRGLQIVIAFIVYKIYKYIIPE